MKTVVSAGLHYIFETHPLQSWAIRKICNLTELFNLYFHNTDICCHMFYLLFCNLRILYVSYSMWGLINPLNPNFTKWSNTLKQFVGKLRTDCLSLFDHFVGMLLKRLMYCFAIRGHFFNGRFNEIISQLIKWK